MSNNQQQNPLSQFYRVEKIYVSLPSGGVFYDPGVVELNDDSEVGIKAMTAADEVLFKNPDALLNGEAIRKVILSCVPQVNKPENLLSNDIDTLMTAIRHASYGDKLEIEAACPNCKHNNTFNLSMEHTLSTAEKLEESYPVNLSMGLTAYVRPYTFNESSKAIKKSFEENNIIRNLENPSFSEEHKMKILGNSIDSLSKLSFELVANCVMRVCGSGDSEIDVTDKKHINEFIKNVGREDARKIQDKLDKINAIGIKKEFGATCTECGTEWEVPIDFNPATFFTASLED
jgi:hypothetical protein